MKKKTNYKIPHVKEFFFKSHNINFNSLFVFRMYFLVFKGSFYISSAGRFKAKLVSGITTLTIPNKKKYFNIYQE